MKKKSKKRFHVLREDEIRNTSIVDESFMTSIEEERDKHLQISLQINA